MFFFISGLALSAAYKISIWVLEKTYDGIVCITNVTIAAAVAAYSGSSSNANSMQSTQHMIEMTPISNQNYNTNDERYDFSDCIILSHDV